MAVLKKIKFGNSENNIQFTEVKPATGGVITATGTHTDLTDVNNPEYVIDLTIADDGTLLKENGALKVGTVPAAQVSVAAGGHDASAQEPDDKIFVGDDVETVLAELNKKITDTSSAAKTYKIVEAASHASTSLKEYKVQVAVGDGNFADDTASATIVVPKDQHLKSVVLVNQRPAEEGESGPVSGQFLKFTYVLNDGTESDVYVDVSAFLAESEFGDGLEVSGAGVVSTKLGNGIAFGNEATGNKSLNVKIDSTSETFLTVGADGVKLAGVQDAINNAVNALDATDTAVEGKYVSKVDESNGIVTTTKVNVSDAPLNGYEKGDVKPASTAIVADDTINEAFSKIEFRIDDNEQVTSAALNNLNSRIEAMDKAASAADGQVVTTVAEADGVVSETKANVKDLQLGGYLKDTSATGDIGGTDTINTALSKLENAIDAAASAAAAGHSKVVQATSTGNEHVTVTASQPDSDGAITYTIGENDIASASDLTAEVTRAKAAETAIDSAIGLTKDASGETRTFTPTTNYGGAGTASAATSVMDNMGKIDAALKAVSDKADAIQYKVNGTTLEFYGMTSHT